MPINKNLLSVSATYKLDKDIRNRPETIPSEEQKTCVEFKKVWQFRIFEFEMFKYFFKLPRVRNGEGENLAKDFKNSKDKSKLKHYIIACRPFIQV